VPGCQKRVPGCQKRVPGCQKRVAFCQKFVAFWQKGTLPSGEMHWHLPSGEMHLPSYKHLVITRRRATLPEE
jgi:hypothetical protein